MSSESARFATRLRLEDVPDVVVHEARRRIVDTLGCALGGFDSPPGRIAREMAATHPAGHGASVLGLGARSTPEMAAFANTVMTRYLDFNDVLRSAPDGGHPSDMIPAILAVAETHHASGRDAMLGVIAAYQAAGAIPIPLRQRGWDYGTVSCVGVAVGAGRVMRLGEGELGEAIALAVTPNVALRVTRHGELSMWKACATATTNRNAVFAVRLAAAGMTGPSRPFEGRHGVIEQVAGPFELELDPARHGYRVAQSDLKCFPCHGNSQPVVATLLEMRDGIPPDEVESVEIRTYRALWMAAGGEPEKWDPTTRETADHSLPYLSAVALRTGGLTPDAFTDEAIRDPDVRRLMARVRVLEDAALTALHPSLAVSEIEIRTRGGGRRVARTGPAKGSREDPLSDEEISDKFRRLAGPVATAGRSERVLGRLWEIDRAAHVRDILEAWAHLIPAEPAGSSHEPTGERRLDIP